MLEDTRTVRVPRISFTYLLSNNLADVFFEVDKVALFRTGKVPSKSEDPVLAVDTPRAQDLEDVWQDKFILHNTGIKVRIATTTIAHASIEVPSRPITLLDAIVAAAPGDRTAAEGAAVREPTPLEPPHSIVRREQRLAKVVRHTCPFPTQFRPIPDPSFRPISDAAA